MTKGDMIRSMNDEALAEWIHNIYHLYDDDDNLCVSLMVEDDTQETEDSYGCLLEWLQEEV